MAREPLRTTPRPGATRSSTGRPAQPPVTDPDRGGLARRVIPYVLALLLGAGLYAAAEAVIDGPSDTEETVAELRAAEVVRDKQQVIELTALARNVVEQLLPAVEGLSVAVPPQEGTPPAAPVPAAEVSTWRTGIDAAAASFEEAPSAGTEVNVARGGLDNAVEQLSIAVSTYEAALGAEGDEQQRLLALAGEQRTAAVVAWSVGATQLDYINVESGAGHAHVTLPITPGTGAFSPDGAPEGSE